MNVFLISKGVILERQMDIIAEILIRSFDALRGCMGFRQVDRNGLRSAVTSLNGVLGITSKKHEKDLSSTLVYSPYSLKTSLGVFQG